jgi:hypothetical protein
MSRQHPWRADSPDAVIVARPSKWGNPFRAVKRGGEWIVLDDNGVDYPTLYGTHAAALRQSVALFEWDLTVPIASSITVDEVRSALAGRDLACWCPLDQPCHADVLLEIANRPTGEVLVATDLGRS